MPPLIGRDARWPPAAISSYFGWRQYTLHINPFIWQDIIPRRTLSRLDPYCHLKWQRYTAAQPKAFLTWGGILGRVMSLLVIIKMLEIWGRLYFMTSKTKLTSDRNCRLPYDPQ